MGNEYLIQKAVELKRQGKYSEAENIYLDILHNTTNLQDRADTYYSLAKIYFLKEQPVDCLICCENVLILNRVMYPEFESDFQEYNKPNPAPDAELRMRNFLQSGLPQLAGNAYLLYQAQNQGERAVRNLSLFFACRFHEYTGRNMTPQLEAFVTKYNVQTTNSPEESAFLNKYMSESFNQGCRLFIAVMNQPVRVELKLGLDYPIGISKIRRDQDTELIQKASRGVATVTPSAPKIQGKKKESYTGTYIFAFLLVIIVLYVLFGR